MRVGFPIFPRRQADLSGVLHHVQHVGGAKGFDDVEDIGR